jgi:hypothetical protein
VWPANDGHFVIDGLSPGTYKIIAVDRLPSRVEQSPTAFLTAALRQASEVRIGERDTAEIALTLSRVRE